VINETSTADLSNFDFMELVVFDRKVDSEGFRYAVENYPPVFEHDGYRPCDDGTLSDLRCKYADRINEFWEQENAVDLHNAHVIEANRREREREMRNSQ